MQTLQIVPIMSCRTWTSSTSFFIQLSYILSLELFQSSLSILWIDNVKNYRTIFFLGLRIMVVCLMFPHKIRCRYCISDNNLIDWMLWSSHCRLSGSTRFLSVPSLIMFIWITYLRFCLPNILTMKLHFFLCY